ncbi:MAG: rane protein [Sphingomonas bacterium]|nr:rane protein [Sphingomonas bacterium]
MRARRIVTIVGVAMALIGALWIGQGLGYIRWPASSFMLSQRVWADYGAALAVAGLLLVLLARRYRR